MARRSLSTHQPNNLNPSPSAIRRSVSSANVNNQNRNHVIFFERPSEYVQGHTIQIYTDASTNIHTRVSGIGLFYGEGHELNESRFLPGVENSGEAEIMAARTALEKLIAWRNYKGDNVDLNTDYLHIIRWLQLRNPDWRFAAGFQQIYDVAQRFPQGVLFRWVPAHTGIDGNEEADSLAREAMQSQRSRSGTTVRSRRSSGSGRSNDSGSRDPDVHSTSSSEYLPSENDSITTSSASASGTSQSTHQQNQGRRHSRSNRGRRSSTSSSTTQSSESAESEELPRSVFITPRDIRIRTESQDNSTGQTTTSSTNANPR